MYSLMVIISNVCSVNSPIISENDSSRILCTPQLKADDLTIAYHFIKFKWIVHQSKVNVIYYYVQAPLAIKMHESNSVRDKLS